MIIKLISIVSNLFLLLILIILIQKSDGTLKICDFGFARKLPENYR